MLYKLVRSNKIQVGFVSLLLIAACLPVILGYLRISLSANFLWVLLLPFAVYVQSPGIYSPRYAIPAIACLAMYPFIPSPFFLFVALCFTIFFIIETRIGKLNRLAPVVVVLITPLTRYAFEVFSFPIRIKLTAMATWLMNLFGFGGAYSGNIISMNGQEFSVDTACMGLKLLITSLLLALLLVTWQERKYRIIASLWRAMAMLGAALFLVMVANFLRIILLVLFNSPPNSFSHEMIGIGCLLLVVVFPLFKMVKHLIGPHDGEPVLINVPQKRKRMPWMITGSLAVLVGAAGLSFENVKFDMPQDPLAEQVELPGFEKEILENHVVKFTNEKSIIYLKPNKGFYRTNHHPMICWRGGGFSISNERVMELGGTEIFVANLNSENENYITAWWFDNGQDKTISQTQWRWNMMKGSPSYRLVNVTSEDMESLFVEVNFLFGQNMLSDESKEVVGWIR